MKIAAVVAEYNPLHMGHRMHLAHAKQLGEATVVVQSGDFCQRGGSTVLDKYTRAVHAIKAGADIVVELPVIYSVNCADRFAYGAVKIVRALGKDCTLCFGSEEGDLSLLEQTAQLMKQEPEKVAQQIQQALNVGTPYPIARNQAWQDYCDKHNIRLADITKPNNILALEYLKHADGMAFDAMQRTTPYFCDTATWSSSYIRERIVKGETAKIDELVPDFVYEDLERVRPEQDVLYVAAARKLQHEVLFDAKEGLQNRIVACAKESSTFTQALQKCATKRYTAARIRRLYTYALLGLTEERYREADACEPYFGVLAIRRDRLPLLSHLSELGVVCTTQAQLQAGNTSMRMDAQAHELYPLLRSEIAARSMQIVDD